MSEYQQVLIETYQNHQGGSSKSIRARPVPGQGLDISMNVECSSKMRNAYPVGVKILIDAKITSRDAGTCFLYAHYNSPYRVLSEEEAESYIQSLSRD